MLNKLVYSNLVNLRNSSVSKNIYVDLKYNKLFLQVLDIFYRRGFILGYVFNNLKYVRIFLKYYKDKGLLGGLMFSHFKPNFSYKALKYLRYKVQREQYFYIFSTSKGLLSLEDIFSRQLNIGGILYFYVMFY